jgi:radical SAM superfamily enzyme YgiQ (UPF0313 family)
MIDLVLIHPGAVHGIYGELGGTLTAIEQALWCRIIASYFLDRGKTVAIIDQEAEHLSPEQVAIKVTFYRPRLVAICVHGHQPSASTQQMTGARAVAQAIRVLLFPPPILMLGNHPSALPERTLREEPVDFVCDGEGPLTIEGLLEQIHKHGGVWYPQEIPGLVWSHPTCGGDERAVANPRAPLLDLDCDLHGSSAWHLLPMHLYRAHNWQCLEDPTRRQPYASIHTSLGCSFKCHFCMINVFQHSNVYRRRDPRKVVDEIVMLYREYGIRTFKITDELFVLNRGHFREICHRLIASGIADDLNIWAYSRTDTVHDDDLPLLRKAGIKWLALGIEAGSAHVRAGANKRLRAGQDDNAEIRRVVAMIQAAGINVIGNYIFGLRGDTMETMGETLDLARSLRTEFANFYCAMAYPGSPLYDQALAEGWTPPSSWAGYSQHNSVSRPLDTETVPAAEVLRFRDTAFTCYFTDPGYLAMIRDKFGQAAVEEIRRMTSYTLKRDLLEEAK